MIIKLNIKKLQKSKGLNYPFDNIEKNSLNEKKKIQIAACICEMKKNLETKEDK